MHPFHIRRAVLSVTDKTGLVDLARTLVAGDVQLFASGGTAQHLQAAGIETTAVEELTHLPELLDGRVKTLHPGILAGVLADKSKAAHRQDLERHGWMPIDLVVVNFYAFDKSGTGEIPIEAIDIGGPTLVRAAAKNSASVVVLSAPEDYGDFRAAFEQARLDLGFRRAMAARAFARVADYDRAIAERFIAREGEPAAPALLGHRYAIGPELRYGENPHQTAQVWFEQPPWGLGALRQHSGDALSFNNFVDLDAALDLVFDLGDRPAAAIIKHNNPCGAAQAATPAEAFAAALASDPVSAYGGIVAFGASVDAQAAEAVAAHFFEAVAAPSYSPVALTILHAKKRLRVLEVPRQKWSEEGQTTRALHGALLVQDRDQGLEDLSQLEVVTRAQPSASEREDAAFLQGVAKHVRSNAIVIGRGRRTLGIGAGQMSRVDSCELAVRKARAAGHDLRDSVAASDAFFPFPDGVERLGEAGIKVIVQPGGSKRDADVIAMADRLGLCMLLTHRRHFRH